MKKQHLFVLCFLVLLGYLLRIVYLGFQCGWTEESYSFLMSLKNPLDIYFTVVSTEFNPPGFYWLGYLARSLFGYNEWALRLPSVIAGVLLIPVMYFVGREFKDDVTGLFCAGFVSISYPLVYYSQFARAYELSFLLFAIALFYWLKLRGGDTHRDHYLFFGIFLGLNAWVHFFSLIPLYLLWVTLLFKSGPGQRLRVVGSACVAVLISLPLYPMFTTFLGGRVYSDGVMPYGLDAITVLKMLPIEFFSSAMLIFVLLILMGVYTDWRRTPVANLVWVVVLTVILGVSLSTVTMVYGRYLMYVVLILFLFAASFLSGVLKDKPEKLVLGAVIGFPLLLLLVQASQFINHYTVQQYICSFLP